MDATWAQWVLCLHGKMVWKELRRFQADTAKCHCVCGVYPAVSWALVRAGDPGDMRVRGAIVQGWGCAGGA